MGLAQTAIANKSSSSLTITMDSFKGKGKRTSSDQYEEFLSALDVNFLLRKAANASTPVMEISEEGGVWTIKTSTTLKSMELKFKLGEEFEEKTPDGREVTAIVTLEGNSLVSVQKAKKVGQQSTKVVREFNGDECIKTSTVDGKEVLCVEKFKRMI